MPTTPMNRAVQHLLATTGRDGTTDGELLNRFLSHQDDAALAALVRRHGPMVWGVCRRILRSHHDAEDAFQATFLVLVTKAATLPNRETVGNWLYGVAQQTAVRMRTTGARRGVREKQVTVMPEPATADEYVWNDLAPVVDEELSRLPDKYRVLVVLCDLEGVTRKEVARRLGIPEGTAASRLATARAMLAKRLARRGVVVSGVLLGAVLPQQSASATVPALMVASTIKAASLLAAGQAAGVVSVKVAALTQGMVNAMFVTKIKSVLAVLVAVGVTLGGVGAGIGLSTNRAAVAQSTNPLLGGKQPAPEKKGDAPKAQKEEEARDLTKIEPPGGVPLRLVKPGAKAIDPDLLDKISGRVKSVPEKDLERWVAQLRRIADIEMGAKIPSLRAASAMDAVIRTDFVIRMGVAFDGLKWNAPAADKLYKRACTMPVAEGKAWREAFEAVLQKKIGIEPTGKDELSNLAGGPPWTVPLVLIPVDALHEGQTFSAERSKKYLARLKQLTKDDVALWKDKVDRFGGTELDAAVNIILLDEFFGKERFLRDKFKAAIEPQNDKKPAVEKGVKQDQDREPFTAWGKEVGGMQAGLGFAKGEKRAYHHGETVTLVVRVRNVGKENVRLQHTNKLVAEEPPMVTKADGSPVSLEVSPPPSWPHGLNELTLTPGKEVDIDTLQIDLKAENDHGDSVATLCLRGTGKFRVSYDRLAPKTADNIGAKLATGGLELEVKEAEKQPQGGMPTPKVAPKAVPPAESPSTGANKTPAMEALTAWGDSVGGLQAGLGFRPGEQRAYRIGETVKLVVRVRNVGPDDVTFHYYNAEFREYAPVVTDVGDKRVPLGGGPFLTGLEKRIDVTVAPGKTIDLGEITLTLRPAGEKGMEEPVWKLFGTGKFQLRYDRVGGNIHPVTDPEPILGKVATGKLELEVTEPENLKEKQNQEPAALPSDGNIKSEKQPKDKEPVALPLDGNNITPVLTPKDIVAKMDTWVGKDGARHWDGPAITNFDIRSVTWRSVTMPDKSVHQHLILAPEGDADRFKVELTQDVQAALKKLGTDDLEAHFRGKSVRIAGRIGVISTKVYGSPAVNNYDLRINTLDQIIDVKASVKARGPGGRSPTDPKTDLIP